jgi:hypothetical protein
MAARGRLGPIARSAQLAWRAVRRRVEDQSRQHHAHPKKGDREAAQQHGPKPQFHDLPQA